MIRLSADGEALLRQWLARSRAEITPPAPPSLRGARLLRRLSAEPLTLTAADSAAAAACCAGWQPQSWSPRDVLRTLSFAEALAAGQSFVQLETAADLGEREALARSLPLWQTDHPDEAALLLDFARRAARDAATSVFACLVLDNPYPLQHFPVASLAAIVEKAAACDLPLMRLGIPPVAPVRARLCEWVFERQAAFRPVAADVITYLACAVEEPVGSLPSTAVQECLS